MFGYGNEDMEEVISVKGKEKNGCRLQSRKCGGDQALLPRRREFL